MSPLLRFRAAVGAALVGLVPLGLATKSYDGPGRSWVEGHLGGTVYELFWILLLSLVFPRASVVRIGGGVLVATCIVELSQLWHPPWLDRIRATWPGAMLLGSTFNWVDVPFYFVGALMGVAWMAWWTSRFGLQRARTSCIVFVETMH